MANRLSARDFGLTLEEVHADLTSTKGRLALAGIPVLALSKVRAEQTRILHRHTKPVMYHLFLLLVVIAFFALIGVMAGALGSMVLGWSADVGMVSLTAFLVSGALGLALLYTVLHRRSGFAPWSNWRIYIVSSAKDVPPEILEREQIVRKLFPRARIWVEALDLDPFIFLEVDGEEPICFGVWDEREGETYFA